MQSGSAARIASNTATGSLTYIDGLITSATAQGLYQITVDPRYINEGMVTILGNYGYQVSTKNDFMGTNNDYVIRW
jgi:hypothetical protein